MAKLILGIAGEMVSGKGTITKYIIENYNASAYRFSTAMRDILDRIHIEQSRENIQKVSEALRKTFGEDVFAKSMSLDVQNDIMHDIIVVDGVRRMPDIKYLLELPNFKMIYVNADIKIKYERIINRRENIDDQTKTFEQFEIDHQGEAESQIKELKKSAFCAVDNNGTFADLYKQIYDIIAQNLG